MLIGLFTLLTALVFGGNESPFILQNAEKIIKKEIQDKDRKKEIQAMMKEYKKEWKALNKTKKKQAKSIAKLNKDRNTATEQLAEKFEKFRVQRVELNQKLIDGRIKVARLIEQEEWDKILTDVVQISPKAEKKLTKAEAKVKIKQDKKLQSIGDEIEAVFSDPVEREQATQYLLQFEDDIIVFLTSSSKFTYRDQEALQDRSASKEEIAGVIQKLEDYRANVHHSFLELRKNLVELSNEKNWPKLAKALNKFVK